MWSSSICFRIPASSCSRLVAWKVPISDGDIPCDTSLVLGQHQGYPYDADVVFSEPFSNNDPYPLVPVPTASMELEVVCSLMVNSRPPEPEADPLQVVNPVEQDLVVYYELGLAPGTLELRDLQGRLLIEVSVEPGSHRMVVPAGQVPAGIYILTLRSEGKVYDSQKILFR